MPLVPLTQDGIARQFAADMKNVLRYDHSQKSWYVWSGSRWRQDAKRTALEKVRKFVHEVSEGRETKEVQALRRLSFAIGVERFAQSDERLSIEASEWDTNVWLLGTPGGTIDLRSGSSRAANPSDMISRATSVVPSCTYDCPAWDNFMLELTSGDPELVEFLKCWSGYCLTGDTSEQMLFFGFGPGGNGKSVFVNALNRVLGSYAAASAANTFTSSGFERHSTDIAMLHGARLVVASETERNRAWAESLIKQATGGDPITARFMRHDNFTFTPRFKLMMMGNHPPSLHSVDQAMKRRVVIIPLVASPKQIDTNLSEKLHAHSDQILRWMIDGCLLWQTKGLTLPGRVMAATQEYFEDQDLLGQWLRECCHVEMGDGRHRKSSAELYESWCCFSKANGHPTETMKAFVGSLKKLGFQSYRASNSRGFTGITFRDG